MELSHAEFGEVIGVSRQHVWYMATTGDVGRHTAKTIVDKTGGEITYDDLYEWERPTQASA